MKCNPQAGFLCIFMYLPFWHQSKLSTCKASCAHLLSFDARKTHPNIGGHLPELTPPATHEKKERF
jgi:hypothetical protein